MSIIGGLAIVYRILTIVFLALRNWTIQRKVLDDDRDALEAVIEKLTYFDWFVLKRLADNINRMRFGELVQSINHNMPGGSDAAFRPLTPPFSPSPWGGKGFSDSPSENKKLIDTP